MSELEDIQTMPEPSDEDCRVFYRRYKEARSAGLTLVEARLFAESGDDISLLRKCVSGGCPVLLLAKILV